MNTTEIKEHLQNDIIPFWKKMRDDRFGGYYGRMDVNGVIDETAEKGCILNSRILWFFSSAYMLLREEDLLEEARHAYAFLTDCCIDREQGGIYWSMSYDGKPLDTTKHTYNQAFAIYALSAYYEASGQKDALALAMDLMHVIEEKCSDDVSYLEALDRYFQITDNDKLSENGVMADRTMNTILHIMEAYTGLYHASGDESVRQRLYWILDMLADRIYNPELRRLEVFFGRDYNSILDLHSYGHDIETSWLIDRATEVLGDPAYRDKMTAITKTLTEEIYQKAFDGHSIAYECEKGVVNTGRIWWAQAEAVIGFLNGYQKDDTQVKYLEAARSEWEFIKNCQIIPGVGEWYDTLEADGTPVPDMDIVQPWKCPYHNGRMCIEVLRRLG